MTADDNAAPRRDGADKARATTGDATTGDATTGNAATGRAAMGEANGQAALVLNGARLLADAAGCLIWPERRALFVADLHLEKGSSFAVRGRFLPPYDTAATVTALTAAIDRHAVERVFCLGDSFHDEGAGARLAPGDLTRLAALTGRCDWTWIAGNHDPSPAGPWGGRVAEEAILGPLVLRHEAVTLSEVEPAVGRGPGRGNTRGAGGHKTRGAGRNKGRGAGRGAGQGAGQGAGEISGHFHPKAAVRVRNRRLSRRCFVTDGRRLILPSFGAYTGGLSVLDPAIARHFPDDFQVLLIGRDGLFAYPSKALVP